MYTTRVTSHKISFLVSSNAPWLTKELDGSFNIIIHVQLVGQAPSIIDQIKAKHRCTAEGILSCYRATPEKKKRWFFARVGEVFFFWSMHHFCRFWWWLAGKLPGIFHNYFEQSWLVKKLCIKKNSFLSKESSHGLQRSLSFKESRSYGRHFTWCLKYFSFRYWHMLYLYKSGRCGLEKTVPSKLLQFW